MICSQCGNNVADGTATCPNCGAQLASANAPSPAQRPAAPASAFKFDLNRLSRADQIAGGASVVLFISLFLPWFGVSVSVISVTADGLRSHGYLWITLILCLAIVAYLAMAAGYEQMPMNIQIPRERLLLIATGINLVLVLLAFLLKPGGYGTVGVGWEFGAFVGLIAAVAACAPLAIPAIQARRSAS
jgi:hypothetical protein